MTNGEGSALVELRIPCRPEFVGVARLAILGVASRMKFSYDEVEDVRLAVGEACTTSVEWAERNSKVTSDIILRSEITPERLTVDIWDEAGGRSEANSNSGSDQEPENLGALLITLLVDEVTIKPGDGGTHVRLVKYAGQR